MKKQSYLIVAILMAMFSFSFLGCDREDPTPPGPDPGGDSTVVSPQLNILLEGDLQIDPQGGGIILLNMNFSMKLQEASWRLP